MTDFASIGIQLDSRPLVDGAKAMDAVSEASVRVDKSVGSMNGQMTDTAKIMRAQADQAKATAAANAVLGNSTTQMTLGSQLFIDKLREQAAMVGMSRSQMAAYQAAQMGVSKEAMDSVAKLKAYEDAIKAASEAQAAATKQSNVLLDAIKLLATGYGALKMVEYVRDATMLAARYETLGIVSTVVGKNAGYTKTQMDTATDAIARQGITMIESRQSAIKLVQAHVDLSNATGLARIAQDAAVIGNINSSEAFDRLVNGISRGNVLILRNIGINVNLQSAYEQMAASLGKSSKELTENERVQARVNAVFDRGTDIATTYAGAMDTAGKQIKSMQRYTEDLKTVIGETFTEVLTIGVMALTDNLKDANGQMKELSADGTLKQWGKDLTSVLVGVVNTISNIITMTKLASVEAAHAIGAGGSGGIAYIPPDANPLAKMGSKMLQMFGASAAAPTASDNKVYEDMIAQLSGDLDKFSRAQDVRRAAMLTKEKAAADEKLKIDQDYAAKATALLIENAGKSLQVQQAAQAALAKSVYVGSPTYRDTEAREPKAKSNQVENTELADRIARTQDVVNAEKEMYDTMSKMDDMFHAAGKMGDEEFYKNKKAYAAAAAKDQTDAYTKQIADLQAYHNSTAAEAAKHAKQINDITAKRTAADVKAQDEANLLDAKESLRIDAIASASDDASNKYISDLDKQTAALEVANGKHQKSASLISDETAAQLRLAAAAMAAQAAAAVGGDHTQADVDAAKAMLATLLLQADAQDRMTQAIKDGEAASFSKKQADRAIQDWQRVGQSISESLTSAFGAGGKALGNMFQAYAKGMEGQLRAQKQLKEAKDLAADNPEKIAAINSAHLAGAQAQIQGYAGMTSAAQGFFAEGTRGYQAMHAATMVLQGAEIALSLIKGVNAVLTQGEGDPYSAFVRMAAMAAIVVGLGVAMSGGGTGGGQSAADVQKAQGTGSVLGDDSAKSDSVRRSIEQMQKNSDLLVPINQGMLTSLQAIQASMAGLTNLVARTPGLTDGTNMGIATGQTDYWRPTGVAALPLDFFGKMWGKTTQNIVDSGLQYGGGLRDLQSGKGFDQYASVDKTTSSWFGLSKSTSNSVQTRGLNDELSNQFALIFTNLDKSLQAASVALGGSAGDISKVLDSLTLDSTKVSLKGLTGTALTDALNSVVSKSMDEIAAAAFPQLDQFRQVGEGYAETVMRIAGDYAKLDSILAETGTTFGPVGMASIAAREHLIELAGGIDQLSSQASSFAQNFLSQAEQLAPVQKYVTDQLAAMGLASVTTRAQFKDVVMDLANSGALATDAGAKEYAALMALSDAFAKTHAATVDLTKSEQEIADERKDLQSQYDQMTMTSTQLLAQQRAAVDASNRALFDQVSAIQGVTDAQGALQGAYDKQKTALQSVIDLQLAAADATQKQIDALKMGDMSTLSPEQKYMEAQRQFDAAAPGDAKNAAAQALLQASRAYNSSTTAYANDYAKVQASLVTQAASQKAAASIAQQQLAALNTQVDSLIKIDTGVATLNTTMHDLQVAILGLGTAMTTAAAAAAAAAKASGGTASGGSQAALGLSAIDNVLTGIYKDQLGRAPDAAGLKFWEDRAMAGQGYDSIVSGFQDSPEYKALHGSHANGLEFVPFNGYRAELHYGERVQTATAVTNEKAANAQMVQLLGAVLTELRASNTQRGAVGVETLKKLDTVASGIAGTKRELARVGAD